MRQQSSNQESDDRFEFIYAVAPGAQAITTVATQNIHVHLSPSTWNIPTMGDCRKVTKVLSRVLVGVLLYGLQQARLTATRYGFGTIFRL